MCIRPTPASFAILWFISTLASAQSLLSVDGAGNVVANSFDGSLHWSNLTGVPPGFADGIDGWELGDVILVAKSGGDYDSVQTAIDSITDAGSGKPYLVLVAPGVYDETVVVKSYVHLKGFGVSSEIRSSQSDFELGPGAATVTVENLARISDLRIVNQATANLAIAIYGSPGGTRATIIENVVAEANGSGGDEHFAVFLDDSELQIRDSELSASGASGFGTAINAAFGSRNVGMSFPQALIESSQLRGGSVGDKEACVDGSGTGYGVAVTEASPTFRNSFICGGHRGIRVTTDGDVQVRHSVVAVSDTTGAYLFEITSSGSISVANSGVSYSGNKFTGSGTVLRCVLTYDWDTITPLSDGTTAFSACN